MHNNAHLTYICTYIHIITHITHVVNTYKHNYMKMPHKCGHIRVNFLQSVRLQVTDTILHKLLEGSWHIAESKRHSIVLKEPQVTHSEGSVLL